MARALLCDDPQADAQAVGRLASSSKALRQLVRGSAAVVAELQAARKMLTLQRQHELLVAAGRLGADAAFPFDPSDYKQVAQQLPVPADCPMAQQLRVRLQGLAARPELNGREGTVVSHDAAKGRFGVQLDGKEKPLALKADNLLPLAQTTLNLDHSEWRVAAGERGRVAARLLRVSSSLAILDLAYCGIGDEGAKALAAGVAASGSLVKLDLYGNRIGDEGAKALAEAVRVSGSLVKLVLIRCGIGDEGAKALAAGVAASGSMATLYLDYNSKIGVAAKQSLRDAVQGRQGFDLGV